MKPDETASDGVTECNSMTSSEGCNRCNGYTSLHRPKTGKNENPLSRDEVKQVYLELRTNGITPTIRILRDHFKRGSFSTLQKYVSELNGTYTDAKLSELQRSRVPDKVMAQMIEDLTERALKCAIEEDDRKIKALEQLILKLTNEHQESELTYAKEIDEINSRNADLLVSNDELHREVERLIKENNELTNQLAILTSKIEADHAKYEYLDGIANLLKIAKDNPEILSQTDKKRGVSIKRKCNKV